LQLARRREKAKANQRAKVRQRKKPAKVAARKAARVRRARPPSRIGKRAKAKAKGKGRERAGGGIGKMRKTIIGKSLGGRVVRKLVARAKKVGNAEIGIMTMKTMTTIGTTRAAEEASLEGKESQSTMTKRTTTGPAKAGSLEERGPVYEEEDDDFDGGYGGKDRRRPERDSGRDRDGRGSGRAAAKWDDAPPPKSDRWAGAPAGRSTRESWGAPKRGRGDDQDGPPPKRSATGSKRVKVTNIPTGLDWRDIKDAFEAETGEILRCSMDKDGIAWIDYKYHKDAVKAVETFDLGELNNRTIGVKVVDE